MPLSEHRGKTYNREWSKSVVGGGAVGYGAGGDRVLPPLLVVDLVILGFRKKNASRGSEARLMSLPLITQGLLREAPRKSTTANTMGC